MKWKLVVLHENYSSYQPLPSCGMLFVITYISNAVKLRLEEVWYRRYLSYLFLEGFRFHANIAPRIKWKFGSKRYYPPLLLTNLISFDCLKDTLGEAGHLSYLLPGFCPRRALGPQFSKTSLRFKVRSLKIHQ